MVKYSIKEKLRSVLPNLFGKESFNDINKSIGLNNKAIEKRVKNIDITVLKHLLNLYTNYSFSSNYE